MKTFRTTLIPALNVSNITPAALHPQLATTATYHKVQAWSELQAASRKPQATSF